MDRAHFFPKTISYLFSMDMTLAQLAGRGDSFEPSYGTATHQLDLETGPVYHALGEARTLGEPALSGHLELVQQKLDYPLGFDFAQLSGRLVIQTDAHETLDACYEGVVRADDEWHLLVGRAANDVPAKITANAYIATRFDTTSTRHRWLTTYQCIGYGQVDLHRGTRGVAVEFATFDVYAMR